MKHIRLLLLWVAFFQYSALGYSNDKGEKSTDSQNDYVTASALKDHLSILASDDLEGRETGTRGQQLAEAYLIEKFSNAGLLPLIKTPWNGLSYSQPVDIKKARLLEMSFSSSSSNLVYDQDFSGLSIYRMDTLKTSLVFCGYGIQTKGYDDFKGLNLEGKIAVFLYGEPKNSDGKNILKEDGSSSTWGTSLGIYKKAKIAKKLGAEEVLVLFSNNAEYQSRKKRLERYRGRSSYLLPDKQKETSRSTKYSHLYINPKGFAKLTGSSEKALNKHLGKFKSSGEVVQFKDTKVELSSSHSMDDLITANVLGYLPGNSKKDEYVIITCHYDHLGVDGEDIYNGADDDGSGTSALVTLAEAFGRLQKEGDTTKRSILFLAFTGEEKGLLGSEFYADFQPIVPMEQSKVNLNIDMIGRLDEDHEENPNYVYIIGSDMLSTTVHRIHEETNSECCKLELDYTYNSYDDPNNFYKRSDHYNFNKNGVPVIFYFNGSHDDYHKPTDTIEKINFEVMAERTRLIFNTARNLANYEDDIIVDVDPPLEE